MILTMSFLTLSIGVFAQIKVDATGNVALKGTYLSPSTGITFNGTAIFYQIGNVPLSINWSSNVPQIYPGAGNAGSLGISAYQFNSIYAKYHYAGTVLLTSDRRLKENFRTIDKPLDKILQMSGQKYDFISQGTDTIKDEKEKQRRLRLEKDRLGFIAQDLEKIVPEAVFYATDEDRYYIDYNAVIPVIVEAMKAQQIQIEGLKTELAGCCKSNLKSASLASGTTNNLAENIAQLDQNIPNPFTRETKIGCTIPESSTASVLYIYNMNGTQLQQYTINDKGKQTVTINGNSLEPGMYLYSLVVDGKEVDTKRMILTE